MDFLLERPPWFLVGPALGLLVILVLATLNERLAVSGGYAQIVERLTGARRDLGWKVWFLAGVVCGGAIFAVAAGAGPDTGPYGWLGRAFESNAVVAGVLVAGGVLIGFGARTAGGCTSGHGLSGTSFGSRASFVATATFMGTAIAAALATSWVFGA